MLKKLGLAYDMIDVCIKRCMLFKGVHANVDYYVHCGEPQYRWIKRLKVARKVFRHFSFVFQLTWMYNTPIQVELMVCGITTIATKMGWFDI
jgi:phenolic acid decarboxylase